MSNDEQKCREEFHFKLFKERYEEWRDCEEKYENGGGKPDFLIKYPDKILGIEHTELFMLKGQGQAVSPQQREGSLWKVVNGAKIICENDNIPPLEVKVLFNTEFEDTQISQKKSKQLSKQLAEFVEKEFRKGILSCICVKDPVNIQPEISRIEIAPHVLNGHTWLTSHHWIKCAAGERKTDFITDLQKCVDAKNEKYENYLINCNECWLLIVADRKNPAQNFAVGFSGRVADHTYQSKFSKTFYMEIIGAIVKDLVKLKTTCQ